MDRFVSMAAALLSLCGCSGGEPLTPQQEAARVRAAAPGCDRGEVGQCAVACKHGGKNFACQRACDGGDGESCLQLGSRLERGIESQDPELPPVSGLPVDDDLVTDAYERSCKLGTRQGCRLAASRIMVGKGRGKRPETSVTDLLKHGCNKLEDGESCCMMAHLNYKLSRSRAAMGAGINFRSEGRKWASIAEAYGGDCPVPPEMAP